MEERDNSILSCVHCGAQNCVYNNGCGCCTADRIDIQNSPEAPERTACETFTEI